MNYKVYLNNHHTNWCLNCFRHYNFQYVLLNNVDKEQLKPFNRVLQHIDNEIYLIQNIRYDFNVFLKYLIAKFLKKNNIKLIYLHHGHQARSSGNLLDAKLQFLINKNYFIFSKMAKLLLLSRFFIKKIIHFVAFKIIILFGGTLAYITEYVKSSYPFKGFVWNQTIDLKGKKEIINKKDPKNLVVIVANHFSRAHFKKSLYHDLIKNPFKSHCTLLGLGNEAFRDIRTEFLETETELLNALIDYKYIYIGLTEPENWFNLGVLEGLSMGCIPLVDKELTHRIPDCIYYETFDEISDEYTEVHRMKALQNLDWIKSEFSIDKLLIELKNNV